jgi:hypothetical protein
MATAALLATAVASSAATVTINTTSFGTSQPGNINAARAAKVAFDGGFHRGVTEDFEGYAASPAGDNGGPASNPTSNPVKTKVGRFSSIGNDGCGLSCVTPSGDLQVRSGNIFGRYNTTVNGSNFLDSNDNGGMMLRIPGASGMRSMNALSFLLTDIDDVGPKNFELSVGGKQIKNQTVTGLDGKNGNLVLVTMMFSEAIDLSDSSNALRLRMSIEPGDGFGIDDVTVSAVPLPAAGLLLLGGLGGLGLMGRRRAAKAKA